MRNFSDHERLEEQASHAHTLWLAKQALDALAATTNQSELERVLETFEIEPLDSLYSVLGSYLEERTRTTRGDDLLAFNEPF